jgi:hypothetical protein
MFSLTQNIHYKPPIHYQYFSQKQQQQQQTSSALKTSNTTFGGAMIERIHNIRPGCGSCGK